MKKIKLTKGKFAIVDDEDFEFLNQFRWHFGKSVSRTEYIRTESGIVPRVILMHRFIMGVNDSKVEVDHINHDKLDNRRSNLRLCNRMENGRNRRKGKNNTSGYKGVTWDKERGKWKASIESMNKVKHLGRFDNPEEAALAYDKAAIMMYGDFACLNFER